MSETNDSSAQAGRTGKTLSLKKTETSTVKQSFSHGRTKAVVVEKKRARVPGAAAPAPLLRPKLLAAKIAKARRAEPRRSLAAQQPPPHCVTARSRAGVVLRQLTDEEKEARSRALADARVQEAEARKRADADAQDARRRRRQTAQERAAAEKRKTEEDARKAADEAARRHAEEEASRRLEKKDDGSAKAPDLRVVDTTRRARTQVEEEEEGGAKKAGGKAAPKAPVTRKAPDARRRGKLTVTKALSDDDERTRSLAAFRRHLQRVNRAGQQQAPAPAGPREVTIPEHIAVSELANRMARRAVDIIKVLMKNGIMAQITDVIDADTAELVAAEYGHTVKRVAEADVLEGLKG